MNKISQSLGVWLGMAFFLSCTSPKSDGNMTRGTRPGMQAPNIIGITVAGKPFDLDELRGKKVIVDFWASWCGPCIHDAPAMVELYESQKDNGVEMVSIALEKKNDGRSERLASQLGVSWPHQLIEEINFVRFNELAKAYGVTEIPATFLLDEKGKVILENVGVQELTAYFKSQE